MSRSAAILATIRSTLAGRFPTARARAVIAACVLGAVALAVAPAFGQSRPPSKIWQARFEARVDGSLTTTWTYNHKANPAKDPCDTANGTGSGSQRITFDTSKVGTMMVLGSGDGEPVLAPIRHKFKSITVHGSMMRQSKMTWTFLPGVQSPCSGGGDTTPPPKSDCGKKLLGTWYLELNYDKPNMITMSLGDLVPLDPPHYVQCRIFGSDRWAMLPVTDKLPESELHTMGQITITGTEHKHGHEANADQWESTFHWKLTLTKVK